MRCTVLALALGLLPALPAPAATLRVPDNFSTIGAALAASSAGDTVVVRPGTYPERVDMVDGVVLRGEHPLARPILDAMGSGIAMTVTACGPDTKVENFAIANGVSLGLGGGASLQQSSIVFERCRFTLNLADHGGAIGSNESSFMAIDCEFVGNHASVSGGAISIVDPPNPTITGCTFRSNSATAGGAISVRNGSAPGIFTSVFDSNSAMQGAAIWFDILTAGVLNANTIVFQNATSPDGGALYFNPFADPTVLSTIVALGTEGGATFVAPGASPIFGCCDLWGNVGGDDFDGGVDLGTNISLDPEFCDAAGGDFTLFDTSPCLGDPTCPQIGAFGEGCTAVPVPGALTVTSWSRLKAGYRD